MGRRVTSEGNVISDIAYGGVVWFSMPGVGIFKKVGKLEKAAKKGFKEGLEICSME